MHMDMLPTVAAVNNKAVFNGTHHRVEDIF